MPATHATAIARKNHEIKCPNCYRETVNKTCPNCHAEFGSFVVHRFNKRRSAKNCFVLPTIREVLPARISKELR